MAYTTTGKVSDNYDIQLQIEILRATKTDILNYQLKKSRIEELLNNGVSSQVFVNHLKSCISNMDYSFMDSSCLISDVDKEDSICLCKLTLANGVKVIGSFTGQRHQYSEDEMEEKAYQDALTKLNPLEEYSLMSTLKDINHILYNLKMMKDSIEQTLISLILGKSPNLRITF